jgi:2-iminobutanoate/2-iminopropanoate deaminase
LESAGLDIKSVVKTTVYMTDLSLFGLMNELYAELFGDHKLARTTIGVAALPEFPEDPKVFIEIDAVAEMSV